MFKWVEGSSEDENFLKGLLSYLDDEIKGDNDWKYCVTDIIRIKKHG